MPQVYVCPLSRIAETVASSNASHLVSLINDSTPVARPDSIPEANHLFLGINDIVEPMDGMILPGTEHVERLVGFVGGWHPVRPIVVHLLRRHQPFDRGRLHHPLRPQAGARRGRPRPAHARRLALRHAEPAAGRDRRCPARPERADGRCRAGNRPRRLRGGEHALRARARGLACPGASSPVPRSRSA
jgi:hypothetical protein